MPSPKLVMAILGLQITASSGHHSSGNIRALVREPQGTAPFRVYDPPVDVAQSVGQRNDATDADQNTHLALRYLEENHGISSEYIRVMSAYANPDTGVSHVYARQTAGGVDVLDGVANVNVDKHGRVISSSQTFAPMHQVRRAARANRRLASRSPSDSLKRALKTLCDRVKCGIDDESLKMVTMSADEADQGQAPKLTIKGLPADSAVDGVATARQSMMQGLDGTLIPVWDLFLQQPDHSWSARINMVTEDVETLVDRRLRSRRSTERRGAVKDDGPSTDGGLKKRLSYLVIPITKQDPRDGFNFVVNPETSASPNGWVYTNTTSGNNVITYRGSQENVAQETGPGTFAYSQEDTESPATPGNVGAALTNVFYVVNSLHDIFYIYGFTEAAFNFQEDNFGQGGQGNDRVLASVLDSQVDHNEADFDVAPDGQSGLMRLSLFNLTSPERDAGLENGMIAQLYGKGVADRLTGGGTAACLQSQTSRGLSEGWGDIVADVLQQTEAVSDFALGSYVEDNEGGIRSHPYSRDPAVNPLVYADAPPSTEARSIGEVWANMLHVLLAALADERGWSDGSLTDSTGTLGNVVFMHLLVDGLSIQPCEPTFVTARDAILQADQNRYNGDHYCSIWRVFASRGLGHGAAEDNANEYSVPPGC